MLIEYVSSKSINIINSLINQSIKNILYSENIDDIIEEYRDSNGNIVTLDFDNNITNKILYMVNEKLLSDLNNIEKANYDEIKSKYINELNKVYYIPLGIISNTPVLNSMGPKIPYKIDFIGSINNETKINIKEYGINSSLVELVLNINFNVQVIMPFKSKISNINKNIILDSKIIQGKVPDYYGGLISGSLK